MAEKQPHSPPLDRKCTPLLEQKLPQPPLLERQLPLHPPLEGQLQRNPPFEEQRSAQIHPLERRLPRTPPLERQLPHPPPLERQEPHTPPLKRQLPNTPPLQRKLLDGIVKKKIGKVRRAVKEGADVNFVYNDDTFPLFHAIKSKDHVLRIVKYLLRHGADVNKQNRFGFTVLQYAVEFNPIPIFYSEVTRLLLKEGADINIKDVYGRSVWHTIAAQKPIAGLEETDYRHIRMNELLTYQSDVNIRDGLGRTALFSAVRNDDFVLVDTLIKRKADVNVTDRRGIRPLYFARTTEMTALLLSKGADNTEVDMTNPKGVRNLHIRLLDSPIELMPKCAAPKVISTPGPFNMTILHLAAALGFTRHIDDLLSQQDVDINARDDFGMTPIAYAAQIGDEAVIRAFLKAGASIRTNDELERSLLHIASIYGHCSLIRFFIHEDLDPNMLDNLGRNCLHYAVLYRRPEATEMLLDFKVKSDIKDYKTPKEYLHEREASSLIWKMLNKEEFNIHVLSKEKDPPYEECCQGVPRLEELSVQPGMGSVRSIPEFDMDAFVANVKHKVEEVIREAIPGATAIKVIGCGSSFEGSKVGFPDEIDFMIKLFDTAEVKVGRLDESNFPELSPDLSLQDCEKVVKQAWSSIYSGMAEDDGYGPMSADDDFFSEVNTDHVSYSMWFWNKLMAYWSAKCREEESTSMPRFEMPLPPQRHPERSTCTTWVWLYTDSVFEDFPLSIDLVPCLKNMNNIKRSYIVPKIPSNRNGYANKFAETDINKLGRQSYPTKEVKYIKSQDERILNVLITAKLLRKPEVCHFKMKNEKGELVPVSEYIPSFRLKTMFMHLVPVFLQSDISLGKMVLMVYAHLEKCLEEGILPLHFCQTKDVLLGSKLSPELCLLAVRKMLNYVRCLYERDFPGQKEADLEAEVKGMVFAATEFAVRYLINRQKWETISNALLRTDIDKLDLEPLVKALRHIRNEEFPFYLAKCPYEIPP